MNLKGAIAGIANEPWNRALTVLMRMVVGGVFIFSGFAKAVDPWGTFYKFDEYFMALGWHSLTHLSLFFAIGIGIVEMMLGVALVVGAYRRGAPWLALLMLLVFTPLTLWLAVTNYVSDCGCFGDAWHLSNWATFGKNVLLLLGVLYLILFNRSAPCLFGPAVQWIVMALTFAFVAAVAFNGYAVQPLIDFRPYEIGTRLEAANAEVEEDEYIFIYKKDGKEQEFRIDELPDEEDGWEFVDRYRQRKERTQSEEENAVPTHSITVMEEGSETTEEVLNPNESQLLLLFPDLENVSLANTFVLNNLNNLAKKDGVETYGITSAGAKAIADWNDVSMAEYPMYNADDSEIKMLARGNPAVVYVEQGEIKWKRTLSSIDSDKIEQAGMSVARLSDDFNPDSRMMHLFYAYMLALAALLVINRAHLLFKRKPKQTATATETTEVVTETEETTENENNQQQNNSK